MHWAFEIFCAATAILIELNWIGLDRCPAFDSYTLPLAGDRVVTMVRTLMGLSPSQAAIEESFGRTDVLPKSCLIVFVVLCPAIHYPSGIVIAHCRR